MWTPGFRLRNAEILRRFTVRISCVAEACAFSDTEKRREAMKAKIQDIYDKSKQNYGAPKITRQLRKSGEIISVRTVSKYMREMGIKAQWVKPWTITTKDSDFSDELQNILDERFHPERPNAVWCSDITYIWTIDGFVYLTSMMDLFSRKIIAWTLMGQCMYRIFPCTYKARMAESV